jgi:hypothetical protein
MMNWVENGTEPQHVIATKWNNDTLEDGIVMQRPLCPYPQKAVYDGSGDWHAASSWNCKGGDLLAFPAVNGSIGTVKTVDNLTTSSQSNGTAGDTSSTSGSKKNDAKALKVMGEDTLKLAWWGFLAVGFGYML